jgi:hypothetical protein
MLAVLVLSLFSASYTVWSKTKETLKNVVFWDVAPCSSFMNRRFGGTYRLHLQGRKIRERGTSVSRWLASSPPWKPQILHKRNIIRAFICSSFLKIILPSAFLPLKWVILRDIFSEILQKCTDFSIILIKTVYNWFSKNLSPDKHVTMPHLLGFA